MNINTIHRIMFTALITMLTICGEMFAQPVWVTQNPLPQCNTINDVQFIGTSTGYEVGNYGTILKTTNGGLNWVSQNSGTTENLNSISFLNASTGFIAGGFNSNIILKTTNGGTNWVTSYSGSGGGFLAIGFGDVNTGIACGYGGMFMRTTNGGVNWNQLSVAAASLHSIYFTTASIAYIAAANGNVYKSTNGGSNWTSQTTVNTNPLYAVSFIDSLNGYAGGWNGKLVKTTNGGTNWNLLTTTNNQTINKIFSRDLLNIYAVGNNMRYLTTSNGGVNWNLSILQQANYNDLRSIYYVDGNKGYLTGDYGTQLMTTNGGTNWSSQISGINSYGFSLSFPSASTGYAGLYAGGMLKTTNGGANWFLLEQPASSNIGNVEFTDNNTGYFSLYTNLVYKTTDGGNNWSTLNTGTTEQIASLVFVNPNTGFGACNSNGVIVKTTSAGSTWQVINTGFPSESFSKIYFKDPANGFILTNTSNILATTNSGLNWVQQVSGSAQALSDIYFSDMNTGFVSSLQGNFLKTTNAGANWIVINSAAGSFSTIYFMNSNTGYGAGIWDGQANCKRTTNGGVNWSNINTGTNNTVNDMVFTDSGTGYILGEGAMILKTTNGGAITNIQTLHNTHPEGFSLSQNYPNPFNPSTKINFSIAYAGFVSVKVFDITGKEIAVLINKYLNAGSFEVEWKAGKYPSGIYFYTLTSEFYYLTKNGVNKMKKLLSVITFAVFLYSQGSYAQWQPDLRLTYDGGESITSPNNAWALASDGNNVMTVWYDNGDGNYEIYYKRSADGGATWGPDIRLTNDPGISWYSSIALAGSSVNVVWQDSRDGNKEIYCKLSTDGGSSWYGDLRLTNNSAASEYPSADANGSSVHVVWQDNRDGNWEIYHMRSTDGGFYWQAQARLTFNSAVSNSPCVSVSGTDVHVVWEDSRDGGNWCIYYKHSSDDGVTWGPDTRLTFETASNLPVVCAVGSDVHAAWKDNRDFNPEIYYKHSLDGGISWSADTRITNTPLTSWAPALSVSGSAVHLVWYDNSEGNNEIYYSRSLNKGTNWETNTRLTNNTSISKNPFVSASGSAVHIVWYDERDGNSEIYYKKNPTGNPIGIININSQTPGGFLLSQNYPNPFNPSTKINFSIPDFGFVSVKVFDISGKEIAVLVNEDISPGIYNVDFDASQFSSGIYFYSLTAGDYSQTRKMVLIK